MIKSYIIGATAALALSATAASAATLNDGGSICEGPTSLLPAEAVCNEVFGDGGQDGGPIVDITFSGMGEGTIFGGIRGLNDSLYADLFNLDGTGFYQLTLTSLRFTDSSGVVQDPESPFDATWILGGTTIGTIGNVEGATDSLTTIADLSLLTLFDLDASGDATGGNIMEYKLEIAAVPLPAGGLLLLSALFGAGALRRRQKTA